MFITQGEFIQALKDVNKLVNKIERCKISISKLEYLLYEKVKSPMDYDIIGYDGEEPIRQIKSGRGGIDDGDRLLLREEMTNELESQKKLMALYKERINLCHEMLVKIGENNLMLQELLVKKYLKGYTYRDILRDYPNFLYEMEVVRYIKSELEDYF